MTEPAKEQMAVDLPQPASSDTPLWYGGELLQQQASQKLLFLCKTKATHPNGVGFQFQQSLKHPFAPSAFLEALNAGFLNLASIGTW